MYIDIPPTREWGVSEYIFCFLHSHCKTLGIHSASPAFSFSRFSFSEAGRRGGVAVPPFLHLTLLFALRQISSAVTYPRLPFHLLFDLMRHNEGERPKAVLLQLRASTKTHVSRAPEKPPSLQEYGRNAAQGEDTRPPDRLP